MTMRTSALTHASKPALATRRLIAGLAVVCAGLVSATTADASASPAPTPAPGSAWGTSIFSIAVSPSYRHTGLVVASGLATNGCPQSAQSCSVLWVSHNGGARWTRTSPQGWTGGVPHIAVDSAGREVLLAGSGTSVEESRDGGATWSKVGDGGFPTFAPSFSQNGRVVVAAAADYAYQPGATSPITGSGGTYRDTGFAFAPTFPASGAFAPVLLAAADKSSGLPVIQQCTAQLVCQGSTTLSGATTYSIPVDLVFSEGYAQDGAVFARSGRGIYKSTDGGHTFTPLTVGAPGAEATATPNLVLAPGYKEAGPVRTAFAAVMQAFINKANPQASHPGGGIYRTDDGGTTWTSVGSPSVLDQGALAVALAPDGRLFAGAPNGLLCSADGKNWQQTCSPVGDSGTTTGAKGTPAATCVSCSGSGHGSSGIQGAATAAPGAAATAQADANGISPAQAATQAPQSNRRPLVLGLLLLAMVLIAAAAAVGRLRRRRGRSDAA